MRFITSANTDVGISKKINQDSLLIKHATTSAGEVLLAVVCDGMGGLSNGELASATVIRAFSKWFDQSLQIELDNLDMQIIAGKWTLLLKDINSRILEYGKGVKEGMGTTFTGMLFIGSQYLIVHVGDTRAYEIDLSMKQLTTDHTFIQREISRGNLTPEQAKTDKRRNMLLQCIGASKVVEPEVIYGVANRCTYMLCSDGFRHEITDKEMYDALNSAALKDKATMQNNARFLIEQVKSRGEKDNISVILIKAE